MVGTLYKISPEMRPNEHGNGKGKISAHTRTEAASGAPATQYQEVQYGAYSDCSYDILRIIHARTMPLWA